MMKTNIALRFEEIFPSLTVIMNPYLGFKNCTVKGFLMFFRCPHKLKACLVNMKAVTTR